MNTDNFMPYRLNGLAPEMVNEIRTLPQYKAWMALLRTDRETPPGMVSWILPTIRDANAFLQRITDISQEVERIHRRSARK